MQPEKFGRYEVQGLLGEGSMGRVYRAFDPLGHRTVAIKTVRPEFLGGETAEEYLRRFRREAQAAGALSHPSIITVFDVGSDYFVMELLEGATLQALLRERGRLPPTEALRILEPVAAALDYAHARGVIHRDIKPGNLMLLPDGRTKIMDFGVAHLASKSMSVSGQFLGSPSYMAPERILRGEATPRSDLFSFAVVAYECLTGAKPFPGDHVSDVVSRVVKQPAAPPSSLDPTLPAEYDAVFRTALAKDPAERFPTAGAFLVALGWLGEESSASVPLALPETSGAAVPPELGTLVDMPEPTADAGPRRIGIRLALAAAALFALALLAGYMRGPGAPVATLAPLAVPGPPVLSIETTPAGAQVLLDGRDAGVSPLSLESLPFGVHTLKVTHPGYVPTELNVELRPGTGHVPLALPLLPIEARAAAPAPPKAPTAGFAPTPLPGASTAIAATDLPPPVDAAKSPDLAASPAPAPPGALEPRGQTQEPQRISGANPRYPDLARPLRQRGTVIVELVVGESGEPRDLRILESAGPLLDAAALEAVGEWRYEPAQREGVKVAATIRVKVEFEPPPQ